MDVDMKENLFSKEKMIENYGTTRCKNFYAKKHSKICSVYFKSEDFIKFGKYSEIISFMESVFSFDKK